MVNESSNTIPSQALETRFEELERTCFVIMPFGKKKVGRKQVNFDTIYDEIFEPAIAGAQTPERKNLIARRTDKDAFSSSINQEMFDYIMYSRLAFADISGLNPNVFYEIGARHATQESGTVLFRQSGQPIPFDIKSIKVFDYDYQPKASAEKSVDVISGILSESLKRNRLDSPVRLALRAQWAPHPGSPQADPQRATETVALAHQAETGRARDVEMFMRDAEEAIRLHDLDVARTNYWVVLRLDPLNTIARMRLGLILKIQGSYYEALEEFTTVAKLAPDYGEAWKEKGIIEGQIARMIPRDDRPPWLLDGRRSLERATKLIPDDFDAWASLGGVLKNVVGDNAGALTNYRHAASLSGGHPYPLLNALKLEALETGKLNLKAVASQLEGAEAMRRAQTLTVPPTDVPWSYFDVAELHLYQKDKAGFLDYAERGVKHCNAEWQIKTFRDSLKNTLLQTGVDLPGLNTGIELLEAALSESQEG